MYKHILIPTDGSDTADKAVEAGTDFAREAGARVTVSLAEHDRRSHESASRITIPTLVYR